MYPKSQVFFYWRPPLEINIFIITNYLEEQKIMVKYNERNRLKDFYYENIIMNALNNGRTHCMDAIGRSSAKKFKKKILKSSLNAYLWGGISGKIFWQAFKNS